MEDPLAFPWVLICSVPDKEVIPQLREFALWLTSTLQDKAVSYGCTHRFDREPRAVYHAAPGNEAEVRRAYRAIHTDFPEVIVVFHILPEPNSLEYKLMKELADEYDLIRQGVLLEKAITRFEGCDMKEVLGNILQWFSRRISRFIALEKKSCAKFSLRIGIKGEESTSISSFSMTNVTAAVLKVLHHKDDEATHCGNVKALVQVSNYPKSFNEYEIANIFYEMRVIRITKNMNCGAIVEFANEFHAAQAAIEYNRRWIDTVHSVSVIPCHPEVLEQVKSTLCDEGVDLDKPLSHLAFKSRSASVIVKD